MLQPMFESKEIAKDRKKMAALKARRTAYSPHTNAQENRVPDISR